MYSLLEVLAQTSLRGDRIKQRKNTTKNNNNELQYKTI